MAGSATRAIVRRMDFRAWRDMVGLQSSWGGWGSVDRALPVGQLAAPRKLLSEPGGRVDLVDLVLVTHAEQQRLAVRRPRLDEGLVGDGGAHAVRGRRS